MPGFLSPEKSVPLLLIPEYSGINKGQRFLDRSKTAHRKPPVTVSIVLPLSKCHAVGIIQYVTFSDWLLSLINIH